MIEALHVGLRQAVARPQRGPAVPPLHELAGEPEAQLGVAPQVRQGRDAQALDGLGPHADRVGVVEAERAGHADRAGSEGRADGRLVAQLLIGQDLLRDGARVLRVDIELPAFQRVEEDARAADLAPVYGLGAGGLGEQPRDLAQDHRLGELLRADDDLRLPARGSRARKCKEQGQQQGNTPHDGSSRWLRCARTYCSTNGSAG